MKIKRADIILIICLASAALAAMLILKLMPVSKPVIAVFLPDGQVCRYPLYGIDGHKDISVGENVVIRLENGRACFYDSNCRDKTCVKCGWLCNRGDFAACLPNRISARIENGKEGEVDIIV